MASRTTSQRRSRAVQGHIAGAAIAMLGVAIATGDIDLIVIEVSQSGTFGVCFIVAGIALVVAQVVALARLRSP